jgi:uncharacterized protein (TIGR03067 family)
MRRILLLFAVLSLAFAPAPFPKPIPKDLKPLQGEWTLTSGMMCIGVGRTGKGISSPAPLKVTGNQMSGTLADAEIILDGRRTPRGIHLRCTQDGKNHEWLGIYKLDGDILTILMRNDRRPAAFTDIRMGSLLLVFKRKKP